ncbi:MAG: L-threonylcarbamoyladenylate synthase [Spirochaetota bacterium]
MQLYIHEDTPNRRHISMCVDVLAADGIIIYPTDTVYSYGSSILSAKAIERIQRIKNREKNKPFTIILDDFTTLHQYVRNISNTAFKIIKKATPGPYTFIFPASRIVPRLLLTRQKTIGIRIPDNIFARELVTALGHPLISTSVDSADGEYIVEPAELEKECRNCVDIICDAGPKQSAVSTIVDFSSDEMQILREGKGEVFF